ncbi:hypothetical protein LEP1GSC058_1667 [Leptospira fainei serovar Hurstbridge str. BUT 6]|uniref:Activator of Hsp90 ATPase homologue 1/2-like C-terminal domain-containing protein n=1 Tax=Leptospira fainei serovar Hurstbridge str. BUT 6 TaxID=1193011 RepID=S3W3S6_9LEPT|nr:hypothetical protein LEP1GSC058_1667 [Leptospira fainei serovar Hurstbridge str. BUT 6]
MGIKASPAEIYEALTEPVKLAQWWTTDTRGSGANKIETCRSRHFESEMFR